MNTPESVRAYFQSIASRFDALYSGERNKLLQIIDRLLRKDIYDRFELAFRECHDIEGCSVLDIGCGSGRYAIEFARRGAQRVVGIDFAPAMIELAISLSREVGVAGAIAFVCNDFLKVELSERFDYSVAMGFFDYTEHSEPYLRKMALMTAQKIVVSFPKDTFLRSTQRRIRYKLAGCPVYFYKREDVERILSSLGMTSFKIVELQGDYFVAILMEGGSERQ